MDMEALLKIATAAAVLLLAGIPFGLYLAYRAAMATIKQMEGEARGPADPVALDELRGRLEQSEGRVAELEERLDFAERLLAQRREVEQLPGAQQH